MMKWVIAAGLVLAAPFSASAQDAAALLGRIPEPAFVRPAVLLRRTGQGERAHGLLLRGKLGQLRLQGRQIGLMVSVDLSGMQLSLRN